MAPPSPRRSSRARAPNPQSQQSSASSATSVRLERTTRSLNKTSPGKSTPSASLSSEPLDEADESLLSRRRKRGLDDEQEKNNNGGNHKNNTSSNSNNNSNSKIERTGMVHATDDVPDEEDEAVRCICGSEDYPGRPPVEGPDADFFAGIELTEDVTGFFVQCDVCKVWQHGACVAIFSAESSPDEYFCEQCRKDLHKIHSASNGQKYSKYLPLHRPSRATSRSTSITKDTKESARSPKNGTSKTPRQNSASQASKRRSTMNSRDAAYDDELLRRVIEASKEDIVHEAVENSSRRVKRGRSTSEENNASAKRQRTGSRSVSPPAEQPETSKCDGSEDEAGARNGAKKPKNGRSQREKSDKDEKERQRQEAVSKRKGRAERRRAEDSDLSEEIPLAALNHTQTKTSEPTAAEDTTATTAQRPGTPPTSHPTASSSHKRAARSNHKKGKGKNQHTKDRDPDKETSPARSASRETVKNADESTATTTTNAKSSSGDGKHSNAKGNNKQAAGGKMSMLDMKRRVAAIMEFISRTQVDMASENGGSSSSEQDSPPKSRADGDGHQRGAASSGSSSSSTSSDADKFRELSCIEMMDVLTRDMVKWQNHYA
ncbi:transcriptional regulator Cti6 [Ophiocordyceps camponoti-floridani]|uniref:Transcriptional regulator Cti6 n=1 Tax=Ophiocordyceps camponoti-floridani TaxID=2030778 RepID=A0A8H4Q876_9HYPO|nr:transcriptional regulator Cti6 [Ophiocordyceps camponoti-floridani]